MQKEIIATVVAAAILRKSPVQNFNGWGKRYLPESKQNEPGFSEISAMATVTI
ncbi:hypothetical protein [Paenibacillus macerans]|uniref:hypothetical protein n=1 Tax=Paenibacillus macerans TaxID=44252 RepID=UPI001D130DF3|nr:hypothetical protein [Paenibacillus macerans]MBS5911506.1 hypothetical protein [Paenibacillus macerans]